MSTSFFIKLYYDYDNSKINVEIIRSYFKNAFIGIYAKKDFTELHVYIQFKNMDGSRGRIGKNMAIKRFNKMGMRVIDDNIFKIGVFPPPELIQIGSYGEFSRPCRPLSVKTSLDINAVGGEDLSHISGEMIHESISKLVESYYKEKESILNYEDCIGCKEYNCLLKDKHIEISNFIMKYSDEDITNKELLDFTVTHDYFINRIDELYMELEKLIYINEKNRNVLVYCKKYVYFDGKKWTKLKRSEYYNRIVLLRMSSVYKIFYTLLEYEKKYHNDFYIDILHKYYSECIEVLSNLKKKDECFIRSKPYIFHGEVKNEFKMRNFIIDESSKFFNVNKKS